MTDVSHSLLVVTLNVNVLNSSVKIKRLKG